MVVLLGVLRVCNSVLQPGDLVLLQFVVVCLVIHAAESDPSAGER